MTRFPYAHAAHPQWHMAATLVLAIGFAGLFFPVTKEPQALLVWASALLVLTYAAYSAVSVAHQSWGAMLGGDEAQRSRIVAWREGLGLLGVLMASIAPAARGFASRFWIAHPADAPPVARPERCRPPSA